MKKLLLGLGAAVTAIAPIATVVSCNNNDSNKWWKGMISIIKSFNKTKKGGSDVSSEFQNINSEKKRIDNITDVVKRNKELKDFFKKVLPSFDGISYAGLANGVTFATLAQDANDFLEMFQEISDLAKSLTTDKKAKEYGITEKEAKNVDQIALKISSADFAEANSTNGVKIGEQLDKDAKMLIQPMYILYPDNISSSFEVVHKDYTESIGKGENSKEFKSFIINLSKVLNDMSELHPQSNLNEFVSTTKDPSINNWKIMFNKISSITSGFNNEKAAEEYGFDSLQEAKNAGQQSNMLSQIKKGTDPSKDNTKIIIDK